MYLHVYAHIHLHPSILEKKHLFHRTPRAITIRKVEPRSVHIHLPKTYVDLACSSGKRKLSYSVIVIHECSREREVNIGLCVSDVLEGCLGT